MQKKLKLLAIRHIVLVAAIICSYTQDLCIYASVHCSNKKKSDPKLDIACNKGDKSRIPEGKRAGGVEELDNSKQKIEEEKEDALLGNTNIENASSVKNISLNKEFLSKGATASESTKTVNSEEQSPSTNLKVPKSPRYLEPEKQLLPPPRCKEIAETLELKEPKYTSDTKNQKTHKKSRYKPACLSHEQHLNPQAPSEAQEEIEVSEVSGNSPKTAKRHKEIRNFKRQAEMLKELKPLKSPELVKNVKLQENPADTQDPEDDSEEGSKYDLFRIASPRELMSYNFSISSEE
ncbi:uncharacterized protein NESG_01069 [Nematocida ausubeli]|uniref:Uncharacterized protein n=1 Tax=Nematocida ausubeli (strain ATCC PRA-371 / ERTm2) TaxID=1913371 RepID=A0A086J445_NEMA1|nr:uncharacterized protein NESG_01069 [Nematocida ausubeli]KAI5132343.1 hypothetical protein NEAUS07_0105 [Nematocida ausubeli]KAI5147001.1 hypothetical protein NEAUS05_0333 [Nematocida ausubeli]KFG26913.1 hypothetical protein NESG_01069 [Nematocida ausubeli]